jgi:hypothetical protein
MATKYAPLSRRLHATLGDHVRFSFREIEAILGFELPKSARAYAPWWANVGGSHVQAEAWMGAGWRTRQVDVPGEAVSFERVDPLRLLSAEQLPDHLAGEEAGSAFVVGAPIVIDPAALRGGAMRLLEDYCEEKGCELPEAIVDLLNAMALDRRRQLIDWFRTNSPHVEGDSTDLIREAREAR